MPHYGQVISLQAYRRRRRRRERQDRLLLERWWQATIRWPTWLAVSLPFLGILGVFVGGTWGLLSLVALLLGA